MKRNWRSQFSFQVHIKTFLVSLPLLVLTLFSVSQKYINVATGKACHLTSFSRRMMMGRHSKSGRRPLTQLQTSFLKTMKDEAMQVRVALRDKSQSKYTTLKHWVNAVAIPAFTEKFHDSDDDKNEVSTLLLLTSKFWY